MSPIGATIGAFRNVTIQMEKENKSRTERNTKKTTTSREKKQKQKQVNKKQKQLKSKQRHNLLFCLLFFLLLAVFPFVADVLGRCSLVLSLFIPFLYFLNTAGVASSWLFPREKKAKQMRTNKRAKRPTLCENKAGKQKARKSKNKASNKAKHAQRQSGNNQATNDMCLHFWLFDSLVSRIYSGFRFPFISVLFCIVFLIKLCLKFPMVAPCAST